MPGSEATSGILITIGSFNMLLSTSMLEIIYKAYLKVKETRKKRQLRLLGEENDKKKKAKEDISSEDPVPISDDPEAKNLHISSIGEVID